MYKKGSAQAIVNQLEALLLTRDAYLDPAYAESIIEIRDKIKNDLEEMNNE